MVLSLLEGAGIGRTFLSEGDDVQVIFCWHQRSQHPSGGISVSSPLGHQSNTCCSWIYRMNYRTLPLADFCLNYGLYQLWRWKHDFTSIVEWTGKYSVLLYCTPLEKGPRLKQVQEELSYTVRALLDISDTDGPLLLTFLSLFFPHFLAPSTVLCLCSWLSASIPFILFNIALFQSKCFTKFVKYQKWSQNGIFVDSLQIFFHVSFSKLLPSSCILTTQQCSYRFREDYVYWKIEYCDYHLKGADKGSESVKREKLPMRNNMKPVRPESKTQQAWR